MEFRSDKWQNTQKWDSSPARPGEAQEARPGETESFPAFREHQSPAELGSTLSNRRVRTRTHGGVAGVGG
jgi:hypothetical protein